MYLMQSMGFLTLLSYGIGIYNTLVQSCGTSRLLFTASTRVLDLHVGSLVGVRSEPVTPDI